MEQSASYFHFEAADNHPAYPPRVHYHEDIEVYYLLSGSCRYFIGHRTYRLTAGDVVVIPAGIIHKVVYESSTHSRLLLNCTEDYVPASVLPMLSQLTYFPRSPATEKQTFYIYKQLRQAVEQQDCFTEDTIHCFAFQLFLMLARSGSDSPNDQISIAEKAVLYIHKNYASHISLTDTATHCAVSPEHLSRLFKKDTGFGFKEYLNIYRLKKAEALLKSGKTQSIAQTALACGFSDSNYFSSIYKKHCGIAPSKVKNTLLPPTK